MKLKPPGYTVGYHGTPPTHPDYLVMSDYRQDKKLDEMDNKLDQLMINEGIDEDKTMTRDKWKDRGYGALLTLIGLIAFELIKYFTVL